MTTDPHPPSPAVAEAIARLRNEIASSQWFADTTWQPEFEADILAVCAAAENHIGFMDDRLRLCQRAEQAEAIAATRLAAKKRRGRA